MEPGAFLRDWGAWGWLWALGWYGFVLGLLLAPEALAGRTSLLILLVPAFAALLMMGSVRRGVGSRA